MTNTLLAATGFLFASSCLVSAAPMGTPSEDSVNRGLETAKVGLTNASHFDAGLEKRMVTKEYTYYMGHQYFNGGSYVVLVPATISEPGYRAKGSWANGGAWYEGIIEKEELKFRLYDWDWNIKDGIVRGNNGQQYGECIDSNGEWSAEISEIAYFKSMKKCKLRREYDW